MTENELREIERRANAATPGPWYVAYGYAAMGDLIMSHTVREQDNGSVVALRLPGEEEATFIAHARTDIPALVAEVRRLRAALEQIVAEKAPEDYVFNGEDEFMIKLTNEHAENLIAIARRALEGGNE